MKGLVSILVCLLLMASTALAHTGDTDSSEFGQDPMEGFEYDEEFDCWWGEYGGIDCNGDFHTYESMESCIHCGGNVTMWGHYDFCIVESPFPPKGYDYYDGIWVGDDGYYTDDGEFHEYVDPSEYDAEFCSECEQFIDSPGDHKDSCSIREEYEKENDTSSSEDDGSFAGFLLLCCLGLGLIIYIPYRIHVFIHE